MDNYAPSNPIASLYPAPPQPAQNALGSNPLYAVGLIGQINQNQRFQQEFNAQKAVGSAFQNALNPDGSVDQGRLVQGLQNPAAAYAAPAAIGDMLTQRQQQIQNSTTALGLSTAQNGNVVGLFGTAANIPNPKEQDVFNLAAQLSTMGVPGSMISAAVQRILTDPGGIHTGLAKVNAQFLGAAGSNPIVGPITPEGVPTSTTVAGRQFLSGSGGSTPPGTVPTALPPGQSEAIQANQAAYTGDQQSAASTMANVRPLQKVLPYVEELNHENFGPGSQQWNQFKTGLATLGIQVPDDQTAARQVVSKLFNQYANANRSAERSDQGLAQALKSNPNLDLTQPANLALVKNQIGMDMQDAAKTEAFKQAHPNSSDPAWTSPNNGYNTFRSNYYQNTDPRAFSWGSMNADDRAALLKQIGPKTASNPAWVKFNRTLGLAVKGGFVTPDRIPGAVGASAAPGQPPVMAVPGGQ